MRMAFDSLTFISIYIQKYFDIQDKRSNCRFVIWIFVIRGKKITIIEKRKKINKKIWMTPEWDDGLIKIIGRSHTCNSCEKQIKNSFFCVFVYEFLWMILMINTSKPRTSIKHIPDVHFRSFVVNSVQIHIYLFFFLKKTPYCVLI